MIALRWLGKDDVAVKEVEPPALKAENDVKVRVAWAAVCKSDIHIAKGDFGLEFPRTLGHEVAGEVVETGPGVARLKPGDGVVLQPTIFCGKCFPCQDGDWHLCPSRRFVGLHSDGGFAEEVVAPEVNWVPVSAQVPLRRACLIEPLACVVHAVRTMGIAPTSRAVITGAGPSAYLFALVLLHAGVEPGQMLVSGRRDKRLRMIRDLGVRAVDVRSEDFGAAVRDHFGRRGPDVFIDQTGDPGVLSSSLDLLAAKGMLFVYDFMGSPVPFDFGRMQLREIRVGTSTGCHGTMEASVALIAEGGIDPEPLITHEFEGVDAVRAFRMADEKDPAHVKSIIRY